MAQFHKVHSHHEPLTSNYRPLQKVNNRHIYLQQPSEEYQEISASSKVYQTCFIVIALGIFSMVHWSFCSFSLHVTESRIKKKFTEFMCNIEDAFFITEPCYFVIKACIKCTIFAFKMVVCTGNTVFSVKGVQCVLPVKLCVKVKWWNSAVRLAHFVWN